MNTVTRIYTGDLSHIPPEIETGITKDALLAENEGYESFAELVWSDCEKYGKYDDSDPSSDVLCIYVQGES
jgi:hypothetical protein